jgi:hypothetical protein
MILQVGRWTRFKYDRKMVTNENQSGEFSTRNFQVEHRLEAQQLFRQPTLPSYRDCSVYPLQTTRNSGSGRSDLCSPLMRLSVVQHLLRDN